MYKKLYVGNEEGRACSRSGNVHYRTVYLTGGAYGGCRRRRCSSLPDVGFDDRKSQDVMLESRNLPFPTLPMKPCWRLESRSVASPPTTVRCTGNFT